MKKLLTLFLLTAAVAFAEEPFPGLRAVMTPEEFARAGLDRLTPDQLDIINAAVVRHYTHVVESAVAEQTAQLTQQAAEANQKVEEANKKAELATQQAKQSAEQAAQQAQQTIAAERKRSWLDHFGVPDFSIHQEWRDEPVLKAHCTGWVGGNSFRLDNGQVWEGSEPIPFELADRDVEIEPRPGGMFSLSVEGKNTKVRVRRIK